MGRRCQRWVNQTPSNVYFSKIPPTEDNIVLTVSEFEAMRLKHYINLNQKESAEKMRVSQPTFSRILESAHQKTTLALIQGKTIKIFGGNINFKVSFIGWGCVDCNYEWKDDSASREKRIECINCNSKNVYYFIREQI